LCAADFSNYSAWHYRTLLLPRLHNEDINTGAHETVKDNNQLILVIGWHELFRESHFHRCNNA
jgi:hypothetical protein